MSEYRIGTSHAGLVDITTLAANVRDKEPRADPMDYSQPTRVGDGSIRGLGWLEQIWHWDFLSEAMRNSLFAYVGPVYVRTFKNNGSFGYFTGRLVWPEKEPEHYSNRVLDLSVRLIQLVEYTPE